MNNNNELLTEQKYIEFFLKDYANNMIVFYKSLIDWYLQIIENWDKISRTIFRNEFRQRKDRINEVNDISNKVISDFQNLSQYTLESIAENMTKLDKSLVEIWFTTLEYYNNNNWEKKEKNDLVKILELMHSWNIKNFLELEQKIPNIEWIKNRVFTILWLYHDSSHKVDMLESENEYYRRKNDDNILNNTDLKKQLKQKNRENTNISIELNRKTSLLSSLQKEKELLISNIKLLEEKNKESEKYENIKSSEVNEKIVDNWDMTAALELAAEYEKKLLEVLEKNKSLQRDLILAEGKISNLQNWINQFSQTESFLINCEQDIDKCSLNDILKYLSVKDYRINIKYEVVSIIIDFLDNFLYDVTKWKASSTITNEWIWWWAYAKNLINPLVNFLKDKSKNGISTQRFLENMVNLDLKEIIKEFIGDDFSTKKGRMLYALYEKLEDRESMNIYDMLEYLSNWIKQINKWRTDLNPLSKIIDDSLINRKICFVKKLKEVFLKVQNN